MLNQMQCNAQHFNEMANESKITQNVFVAHFLNPKLKIILQSTVSVCVCLCANLPRIRIKSNIKLKSYVMTIAMLLLGRKAGMGTNNVHNLTHVNQLIRFIPLNLFFLSFSLLLLFILQMIFLSFIVPL